MENATIVFKHFLIKVKDTDKFLDEVNELCDKHQAGKFDTSFHYEVES